MNEPCGNCGHERSQHTSGDDLGCYAMSGEFAGAGMCPCWKFIPESDSLPAMRANRKFGPNKWHTVNYYSEPFQPGTPCQHDGCDVLAAARIMVNIWGSVCEVDVCEEHRSFDGKLLDEFPWKKKIAEGCVSI